MDIKISKKDFIDFDKRVVIKLSLVAGITAIIGSIINTFLDFPLILHIIPFVGALGYGITYYMGKHDIKLELSKWLVTINSLMIVNVLWIYNYGSFGPAPYFFVVLYSVLIFIWNGKKLNFITLFFGINLLVIFYIDYFHPGITQDYESESARLIDTYTGILMYIIIIFVLLRLSKTSYIKEYRKAKEADLLKSAFLANMSHEIRTPLNAIVGFSEMLAANKVSEDKKQLFSEIINENNQQLLSIINDILDVSKIESNQLSLSNSECNISEVIEKTKTTYINILKSKKKSHIDFIINKPKEEFTITTDKRRLIQIITNLIDNAIKFTDKGSIELSYTIEKNHIRFKIKDTGIGINEDQQTKIFDRFYKITDNNTVLYRGTGIGLFLSKELANILGGEINVKSKEGEGSTFSFTIPKNNFTLIKTKEIQNTFGISTNQLEEISKLSILIAEDNIHNMKFLEVLLNSYNIDPIKAYDGYKAVEVVKSTPNLDLILMDIKMPNMDGFEAMRKIKEFNPKIRIIAQTANAMANDKSECLKAGFSDYISKPINQDELEIQLIKTLTLQ